MFEQIVFSLDATLSAVSGVALFFAPHFVGDYVLRRKTDGVHWHLLRCIGGQILALGTFSWRLRHSNYETASSCYILRSLCSVLASFIFFNCRSSHPGIIPPTILSSLISICIGSALTYLLILILKQLCHSRHQETETSNKNCRIRSISKILYHLDSIASTAIGTAWIMEPKWLLHKQVRIQMDESHELCGRIMGAFFISSQVIGAHALHWKNPTHRSIAAETRAMCCSLILFAQVWSQFAYLTDWSGNHWVGIALFSTWTLIAVVYRICTMFFGEEFEEVPTKHINGQGIYEQNYQASMKEKMT